MGATSSPGRLFPQSTRRLVFVWGSLTFALHLAVVYLLVHFCVVWFAGLSRGILLPGIGIRATEGSFQFLFSHLLILSAIPGLVAGLIVSKYRHRAAGYVWIVPLVILSYKIVTYRTSVFESSLAAGFHHYLGGGFFIPEFRTYEEMFWQVAHIPDMQRGMDQLTFTSPLYVAVAYGLANWIGSRLKIRIPGITGALPKHWTVDDHPSQPDQGTTS